MPKIRYTFPKGLVQESGTGVYLGLSGTTTRATGGGASLAAGDATVLLCDSSNNTHKVKVPHASAAGEVLFVLNVTSNRSAVLEKADSATTIVTLGPGVGCTLVATAAGDNWIPVGLGS